MSDKKLSVLFGVWALKEAPEQDADRVRFIAERAKDLQISNDLFSNGILMFSCYYPPLKGKPATGNHGAFGKSANEQNEILEWILNMLARTERPDWDRKNFLPSWGGARFIIVPGPEVGAPNLIRLIFLWESGIGGPQCAQFCKRLEEAYMAEDGYY
jgi:hypothetical protein